MQMNTDNGKENPAIKQSVSLRKKVLSRFLPVYGIVVFAMIIYFLLGSRSLGVWFLTQIEEGTRASVYSLLGNYVRTVNILQSQYQMISRTTLDGLQRIFVADTSAMDIPRMELRFFVRRLENLFYGYENTPSDEKNFFHPFTLDVQGKVGVNLLPEGLPFIPPLGECKLLAAHPGEVVVFPLFWSPVNRKFYEYSYWVFPDQSILGIAIEVNPELLAQSERMLGQLKNLPFVIDVKLYSLKTGAPIWQKPKALPFKRSLLDKIKEYALQEKQKYNYHNYHIEKKGFAREKLYSVWKAPENIDVALVKGHSVVVEISMDFSHLFNFIYTGIGIGFLLFLGGIVWLVYDTVSMSLKIAIPFRLLIHSMQTFMAEPATFTPSKDENSPAPPPAFIEIEELEKAFWSMRREVSASMEELKAMNEELENLYMSREKLASRLEHIISLIGFLGSAKDVEERQCFQRILSFVMDILPEAESGILGAMDGEGKLKISCSMGVPLDKLQNFKLKAENLSHREGVTSMASRLSEWPRDFQEEFIQICPNIARGLTIDLRAGDQFRGFIAIAQPQQTVEDTERIFNALGSIASGFLGMQQLFAVRGRFQEDLLRSIISILDLHDPYTKGHSESVAILSFKLAQTLGLSSELVNKAYLAGLIHDIGKLLIPIEILNKPGKLTPEETELIQSHPTKGGKVLSHSEALKDIAKVVKHHHERWDGQGYPDGLMGYEIPLLSRVIAVADAYDAMTSDRSYRKGLSKEKALDELLQGKGVQFDPQIVEAFLSINQNELSSWWEEHDSFWG